MIRLLQLTIPLVLAFAIPVSAAQGQRQEVKKDTTTKQGPAAKDVEKGQPPSKLPTNVSALIKSIPNGTRIGLVVLDRRGKIVFQHNSELELPAASSVKSILLLELFAKYAEELDKKKRDDVAEIVENGNHPSIAHFSSKSKKIIAEQLAGVSIKQLGSILIDSKDQSGNEYSNSVYNAASNVAIALLGGPTDATSQIQKRNDAFKNVNLRRYMLANRNTTGDNTATPLALATLFNISVGKTPKGINAKTAKEIANILHSVDYKNGAKLYSKGGTLYSNPVTQVRSGQYRKGKVRMNYAIMASQELKSKTSGKQQHESLKELTLDIYSGLKDPK